MSPVRSRCCCSTGTGICTTDAELRDQLVTLLLAGHETTATALAWTFERLTRNPQVLARLRATLAENDEDYLECVIKESLRSRPVVSYAMRRTTEPFSVGGYTAPAGAYLGTSVILTHNNPKLYPEPHLFRPERFADKHTDTYAWVPFGGGTRRCLGAAFATYEMKVVLRRIVERCELGAPEQKPERAKRRFVTSFQTTAHASCCGSAGRTPEQGRTPKAAASRSRRAEASSASTSSFS
jgi:cytochrome P450